MSALDFIRQQMDELMGKDRNGEIVGPQSFEDEDVCKHFLCGCCTSDLFTNTKRETGSCGKVHDDKLRDQYLAAQKEGKTFEFEHAHLRYLERLIAEQENELRRSEQRLKATQTEDNNAESDKIMDLGNEIGKKLAAAEAMGEEGKVDEAQTLLDEIETLKREKKLLEDDLKNSLPPGATQQQKLRVCDVCAAYLSLFDSDRRLADHFGGKVHMGCLKIRQQYEEWKNILNKRREAERERREGTRDRDRDRDRSRRSRSRDRDRRDDRDRYRDRDSDRDRRDRDRDSDRDRRDRDRDDRRDRDRDYDRRDRDRDSRRDRRSRSRDRRSSRY